ncbi:MAG TPA: hypothetical protein VHY08_25355 [Bacillota bacterium]|nr:hypothetical protein [Bacillota bacterium]
MKYLVLPYPLSFFAAWVMEGAFRLMKKEDRPLLTRQAVMLLGNNIIYDTSKLRALGFKEKVDFETALQRAVESAG